MTLRVLVLAGGAPWEAEFLTSCAGAGLTVVARCVDLVDLMAAATLGEAEVAVVDAEGSRLDADAVAHLERHGVRVLAVAPSDAADRLTGLGATAVPAGSAAAVLAAVRDLGAAGAAGAADRAVPVPEVPVEPVPRAAGRVVAVWGPTGAPGRSTVALTIAAEAAAGARPVLLVDADANGGTIGQLLGILDEGSGLLAAARKANTGTLDAAALAACSRGAGNGLSVLTGLPRADRRIEVRAGMLAEVLATAAGRGDVVVDTGFGIAEDDRDRMSREALAAADEIVVVGSADPIGLARLVRALTDLRELEPSTPVQVVVNRIRPTLGWSPAEIVGMVEGYLRPRATHLVPEAREELDRAVVTGKSLVELGDSAVRRALAQVALGCFPELSRGTLTRRRGGRARSRCRRP